MPRALEPEMRTAVVTLGPRNGFMFVALDLAGFSSGSLTSSSGSAASAEYQIAVRPPSAASVAPVM
jgi:hypothetical protein